MPEVELPLQAVNEIDNEANSETAITFFNVLFFLIIFSFYKTTQINLRYLLKPHNKTCFVSSIIARIFIEFKRVFVF